MPLSTPSTRALAAPVRLAAIAVLASIAACSKQDAPPAPAAAPEPQAQARPAAPSAPRERREYTDMPAGPIAGRETSTTTAHAIEAEALRGGPHGEPRVFENPAEQAELARGASPKYMNGQFRYYLAGLSFVQQDGACKSPQLAVKLAVENLHGNPTAAIRGRITFARSTTGDGSLSETVAVPYGIDIVGPFADQRGGIRYVTAYVDHVDGFLDPKRWAEIADIGPSKLKVWFTPEVFYYPDGNQYSPAGGLVPARRDPVTCGGGEGSVRVAAR